MIIGERSQKVPLGLASYHTRSDSGAKELAISSGFASVCIIHMYVI